MIAITGRLTASQPIMIAFQTPKPGLDGDACEEWLMLPFFSFRVFLL
jgi:hypothetical protein